MNEKKRTWINALYFNFTRRYRENGMLKMESLKIQKIQIPKELRNVKIEKL